jgi:hypothetical protein
MTVHSVGQLVIVGDLSDPYCFMFRATLHVLIF